MAGHRRKKGLAVGVVERGNRRRDLYAARIAGVRTPAEAVRVAADYLATALRDLPPERQWEVATPVADRLWASVDWVEKARVA